MAIEQTLFSNIEAGKRKRNYHSKMGGSRNARIARWQRFLRAVKLAEENGEKRYMSRLQSKYNVGKFRADLLPKDLCTRTYEEITLEYAERVMLAVTEDYKMQQSRKQGIEQPQVDEQPKVIVVSQESIDAKRLIEDITNAIDEFQSKMNQILTNYLTKAK